MGSMGWFMTYAASTAEDMVPTSVWDFLKTVVNGMTWPFDGVAHR